MPYMRESVEERKECGAHFRAALKTNRAALVLRVPSKETTLLSLTSPVSRLFGWLKLQIQLRYKSLRGLRRVGDFGVVVRSGLGGEHFVLTLALVHQLRHAIAEGQ